MGRRPPTRSADLPNRRGQAQVDDLPTPATRRVGAVAEPAPTAVPADASEPGEEVLADLPEGRAFESADDVTTDGGVPTSSAASTVRLRTAPDLPARLGPSRTPRPAPAAERRQARLPRGRPAAPPFGRAAEPTRRADPRPRPRPHASPTRGRRRSPNRWSRAPSPLARCRRPTVNGTATATRRRHRSPPGRMPAGDARPGAPAADAAPGCPAVPPSRPATASGPARRTPARGAAPGPSPGADVAPGCAAPPVAHPTRSETCCPRYRDGQQRARTAESVPAGSPDEEDYP